MQNLCDLTVPDQLQLMCEARNPRVQISVRVREPIPDGAFAGCRLGERIGRSTAQKYIRPEETQMVYICGPQQMYKEVTEGLTAVGIPDHKVFFV